MLVPSMVMVSVVKVRVGNDNVCPAAVRDDGAEPHRDGASAVEAQA